MGTGRGDDETSELTSLLGIVGVREVAFVLSMTSRNALCSQRGVSNVSEETAERRAHLVDPAGMNNLDVRLAGALELGERLVDLLARIDEMRDASREGLDDFSAGSLDVVGELDSIALRSTG